MKTILLALPILLCAFSFKDVGFIGALQTPAAGGVSARLTEAGDRRITESNDVRIIE